MMPSFQQELLIRNKCSPYQSIPTTQKCSPSVARRSASLILPLANSSTPWNAKGRCWPWRQLALIPTRISSSMRITSSSVTPTPPWCKSTSLTTRPLHWQWVPMMLSYSLAISRDSYIRWMSPPEARCISSQCGRLASPLSQHPLTPISSS